MCEPVTLTALGFSLAARGIGAYSTYKQAQFQSQLALNNAELAKYQARNVRDLGYQAAGRLASEGARAISQARANIAASGVETTTGSVANIFSTSQMNIGADIEMIKANAARQAWGYEQEAQNLKSTAKMIRRAGILTGIGSGLGAIGSLIGGGIEFGGLGTRSGGGGAGAGPVFESFKI